MKKPSPKASVGYIARLAGVSTPAASFALKNRPGVSAATRARILRIAKEVGYTPDARIGSWLARVRDAKSKDLLSVAWLNTAWEKDAYVRYKFQSPYLEGARARGLELGYKIDDIWCHEPGMTMKRLSKILQQRGIEGVIVTHPARHLRLDWTRLAGICIGAALLAPRLHRIIADLNFNLQLALKSLRRLGYRRIGICLTQEIDSASHYSIRALAQEFYHQSPRTDRVPPLFHQPFYYEQKDTEAGQKQKEITRWLKRYKPEVVIGHDSRHREWAQAAGFRVPEDLGLVHLALDDDVLDWAGIYSKRRDMGATAVEWLVSLIRNRQFGIPATPRNILVRGTWQRGRTLASPVRKGR